MNKPLIYVDSDLAISCLMRSLNTAGLSRHADRLLGLTVSNPESARHAQQLIAGFPSTATTEKAKRGALEILSFATLPQASANIQAPIDLY